MTNPEPLSIGAKLLEVLKDGEMHSVDSLKTCLSNGDQTEITALRMQLSILRTSLRPRGRDVICQYVEGQTYYRMVRYITKGDEE